jgi:hypothetical protein
MLKFAKRILLFVLALAMAGTADFKIFASSAEVTRDELWQLVEKAEAERNLYGEATDETIADISQALELLGPGPESYSDEQFVSIGNDIQPRGYGETHYIDKQWSFRVDKGGTHEPKPHVHVYRKKPKLEAIEGVDGSRSHGQTLDEAGVPKKVKEKVRNSRDYKKGQRDLKKMKEAKKEIVRRKLNLSVQKELLIAAALFASFVGYAIAPQLLPWVLGGLNIALNT